MAEKKLPKGITLRKDGRYMWRFQYAGASYSGYAGKVTEAKKAMSDKRYEVEHGLSGKEQAVILDAWFEEWLSTYKAVECKEITIVRYKEQYRRYIGPEFGKMQLRRIRAEAIQRFLNKMAEKYAKKTVDGVFALLNSCFRQAVRNGLISKNPADNVTMPKCKPNKKKLALPAEQEKVFLDEAKGSYFYPLYRLASLTGMRSGEIRGLRWSDIDFDKRIIHVNHTLSYSKEKGLYLGTPKSESSHRNIPMVDEAYNLLRDQRKEQMEQRFMLGDLWSAEGEFENLVFTTKIGAPVNTTILHDDKTRILASLKRKGEELEGFSFHTLRHSFATRCIEAGMNPKALQGILGHSTFNMTMDMYVDAMEESKREEMEKVEIAL